MKFIQLLLLILGLLSSVVATSKQTAEKGDKDSGEDEEEKAIGICEKAADGIFGSQLFCECSIFLPFRGEYELFCAREDICFGNDVVCGSITWTGGFNALAGGDAYTSLCIANITWDLPPITPNPDDLCISYEINIVEALCPDGIVDCLTGLIPPPATRNRTKSVSDSRWIKLPSRTIIKKCEVTIGDETCNSCTVCDDRGGAMFDCSNVIEGFAVTKCVGFRPMLDEYIELITKSGN